MLFAVNEDREYIVHDLQIPDGHSKNNEFLTKTIIVPFLARIENNVVHFDTIRPLTEGGIVMEYGLDRPGVQCSISKLVVTHINNPTPLPLQLTCLWPMSIPFKDKELRTEWLTLKPGQVDRTNVVVIENSSSGFTISDVAGLETIPVMSNDIFVEIPITRSIAEISKDSIDVPYNSPQAYLLGKYFSEFRDWADKQANSLDCLITTTDSIDKKIYRLKRETYRSFIMYLKENIFSQIQYVEPSEMKLQLRTSEQFKFELEHHNLAGAIVSIAISVELIKVL